MLNMKTTRRCWWQCWRERLRREWLRWEDQTSLQPSTTLSRPFQDWGDFGSILLRCCFAANGFCSFGISWALTSCMVHETEKSSIHFNTWLGVVLSSLPRDKLDEGWVQCRERPICSNHSGSTSKWFFRRSAIQIFCYIITLRLLVVLLSGEKQRNSWELLIAATKAPRG